MVRYITYIVGALIIVSCTDKNTQTKPVYNNVHTSDSDTLALNPNNFEKAVTDVLKAFEVKDEGHANKLVSAEHGVIILYRTGVFNEYTVIDKIDFSNTVPHTFAYPSIATNYKLKYEDLPKYNCGTMEWNKHGLYCDTILKDTLISGTPQNLIKYRGDKIAQSQVDKLKKLEAKSRRIILSQQDKDFIFYLTLINNKWYLTAIDRITTDCSA